MKGNRGLFYKNRFKKMEEEKDRYLKGLTLKRATRIFESLTSADTLNQFKKNFSIDNPISLKLTLMKRKNEIAPRSI